MSYTISKDVAAARGRVAGLASRRPANDPALADARRELRAAVLADYVKTTVEALPPLTDEQINRVAVLLRPAGGGTR